MKQRLLGAGIVAAALVGGLGVGRANAEVTILCQAVGAQWCAFGHNNFGGGNEHSSTAKYQLTLNDEVSSLANNGPWRARFFEHQSYGGWEVCQSSGTQRSSMPSGTNDEASSAAIAYPSTC